MDKISPCLWFDGRAEEAAKFYTQLFPDSRILSIERAPGDNPSTKQDEILTVTFSLAGQTYIALNGGPDFRFSEAISLSIDCADQQEVDRYWAALTADGGEPGNCGWLKDRFGLSWQVVPRQMVEMLGSLDRAAAKRAFDAMLSMTKLDVAKLEQAYEARAA